MLALAPGRRAAELDSGILADRPSFVAGPSCGGRSHLGQSDPGFTLRLLMSQLGSKHAFLCEPLEHDRYVHGEKPVSIEFRRPNIL